MRRNESVSKIMTKNPITVHQKQSLAQVRDLLAEHSFHHMPVVSGTKLVGIVTTTDLLRVSYDTKGQAFLNPNRGVTEVMEKSPITIGPNTTIKNVASLFTEHAFHSLPVVKDGELMGIVTTTDVVNYLLEQY